MVGQNLGNGISCQGEGGSCAFRASRVKNALMEPATQKSHEDVIERVWSGGVGRAIIPVMNLKGGVLTDVIRQIPSSELRIVSEIYLKIDHHLLMPREFIFGRDAKVGDTPISKLKVEDIDKAIEAGELSFDDHKQRALTAQVTHVYADSQAFKQCDQGLRNIIPRAQFAYTNCTSDAALEVHKIAEAAILKKSEVMPYVAAIASLDCADMYGLYPVKRNIQDLGDSNLTRYLVLAQKGKNSTAALKDLVRDTDYEQIRRVLDQDIISSLFEEVRFPISVLADVLDILDKDRTFAVTQLLPQGAEDGTLDELHTGWLHETVGHQETRDEATGQLLYSAFDEAHKNPYERVKLLRDAICIRSFFNHPAFQSWADHSEQMISKRLKKLCGEIRSSDNLIKQKMPGRRLADIIRRDYGHKLITTLLVRSDKPKISQHQLLKPFFDNKVDVRVIDILPEVAKAKDGDDKTKTGYWMILEVDGFLGDYKATVRPSGRNGLMQVSAPQRTSIERALFRLQSAGSKVSVLGSYPKDAVWDANWQVVPQKEKQRDGFGAGLMSLVKNPFVRSAATVAGVALFCGLAASVAWATGLMG